jgi:hypothetical protein
MSALNWKETKPGQAKATSREPIATYAITEVPVSERESRFQIQITTEVGSAVFPQSFSTMSVAQRACQNHLNRMAARDRATLETLTSLQNRTGKENEKALK